MKTTIYIQRGYGKRDLIGATPCDRHARHLDYQGLVAGVPLPPSGSPPTLPAPVMRDPTSRAAQRQIAATLQALYKKVFGVAPIG